jgi:hypothetical protein
MSYGSVLIAMIDPDLTEDITDPDIDTDRDSDGTPDQAYYSIWTAGIISLFSSITENKINSRIDQAFNQSPYLNIDGGTK